MNKLTLIISNSVFIIQQPINSHILAFKTTLTERESMQCSVKTSHVFTCFSSLQRPAVKMCKPTTARCTGCRVQQLGRSCFHQLAAAFGPKPRCRLKSAAVVFDRSDVLQTVGARSPLVVFSEILGFVDKSSVRVTFKLF